jgi:hypothetical protein
VCTLGKGSNVVSDFVSAALRGHMPQAGILPVAILLVIVGTLAVGLRLSARREARALSVRRAYAPDGARSGDGH